MSEYRSKVDTWIVVVLLCAAILAVVAVLPSLREGQSLPLVVVALPFLFVLWLAMTTRYVFSESDLLVTAGPFRWRIPLAQITAITPTKNPLRESSFVARQGSHRIPGRQVSDAFSEEQRGFRD